MLYRVELRCLKDTPEEEAMALKQNRVLAFQTTVYPSVAADSPDEAVEVALRYETTFGYRERIWLMCWPVLTHDYNPALYQEPILKLVYVRT